MSRLLSLYILLFVNSIVHYVNILGLYLVHPSLRPEMGCCFKLMNNTEVLYEVKEGKGLKCEKKNFVIEY